jgi:hypothetical protein
MAGWASDLVSTQRLEEKSFAFAGDRIPVVQFVTRHYIDGATSAPEFEQKVAKINTSISCQCMSVRPTEYNNTKMAARFSLHFITGSFTEISQHIPVANDNTQFP